jgi:excisionase family DNA binding protein
MLLEYEEYLLDEEVSERSANHKKDPEDLLSIPEVCQELGMGRTWVYQRIKSGEIPSVTLGHNLKVVRKDLQGYLHKQRRFS